MLQPSRPAAPPDNAKTPAKDVMAPKFGTSGLRGLVRDLTPGLIRDHVGAFLSTCPVGSGLCLGRDLRASSPRIAEDVSDAARAAGVPVTDFGALPTPALALAANLRGAAAIMVTGSHIPADRNGLKFYTPAGEITKDDEAAIRGALGRPAPAGRSAPLRADDAPARRFVERYLTAFGPQALAGRRIGLYAHSSVGRDLLAAVLAGLGAEVTELGRSEDFVPVDTEAVDAATRARLADWARRHRFDAIVSTDGDADRPLLADEAGQIVPGDILGQITAEALGAQTVVTPVSSNTGALAKGFARVERTRIGSPHVIAGMIAAGGRVVGYEANGGFLLGFDAAGPAGPLPALPTRDSFLPLVATLAAAGGAPLSARVAREPARYTRADRLQDVPAERAQALVGALEQDVKARGAFLAELAARETGLDLTDGVRMTLEGGRVVHVRPSGNAPELRLYVEAESAAASDDLLARGLRLLGKRLGSAAAEPY